MLETLKFVRAAVCKTGQQNPAFMHFRITGGTVQANNGRLAMQAPLATDLDCTPHAGQFLRAIAACEDVISLHMEAGRLVVRSGKFKTHVVCCDNASFPRYVPTGAIYPVPQPILPILEKLFPFVATDDRQPWACGVYFVNNSAFVTNSITIVEHWLPLAFPVIANIPRDAIAELLRLRLEPTAIQACAHAVTFHLQEGAWITCRLLDYKWPNVQAIFETASKSGAAMIGASQLETLLNDVAKIEKFVDDLGAVHFHNGQIATVPLGEPGTFIDCPASPGKGIFRADQLAALRGVADSIGFDAYPAPVPFYGGDLLRGAMVGFKGR
jgi:hypothetical protein